MHNGRVLHLPLPPAPSPVDFGPNLPGGYNSKINNYILNIGKERGKRRKEEGNKGGRKGRKIRKERGKEGRGIICPKWIFLAHPLFIRSVGPL